MRITDLLYFFGCNVDDYSLARKREQRLYNIVFQVAGQLLLISNKGFGCLGVTDESGRLIGIITDGDLRRHLSGNIFGKPVEEVMTPDPKTITPDALVASALEILNAAAITALLVVEGDRRPVGIVHMHDLLRTGVA